VGPFNVGIVEFEINATVAGGIFVGIEGAVSGQLGYRQSTCESDAALRLGCPFGGFDVTLTPSVAARAVAQAELGFSCEGCDGASASLDVSLTAGQLSWPLHVAQITVNADQCGQGVSGGQMTFGPGAFEVSARAAGSLDVPSIGTFSFDFTNTFLRCEITLDGVTCAP
jgi:hypothetical protein